jgi:hypothetical protein
VPENTPGTIHHEHFSILNLKFWALNGPFRCWSPPPIRLRLLVVLARFCLISTRLTNEPLKKSLCPNCSAWPAMHLTHHRVDAFHTIKVPSRNEPKLRTSHRITWFRLKAKRFRAALRRPRSIAAATNCLFRRLSPKSRPAANPPTALPRPQPCARGPTGHPRRSAIRS